MATAQQQQQRQQEERNVPVVLTVLAVLAAVAGLFLLIRLTVGTTPAYGLQTEAQEGALSVWVEDFRWLDHDHGGGDDDDDDGDSEQQVINDITAQAEVRAMPASMMPGTPVDGFQRIQVNLSMFNRGSAGAEIDPDDFLLVGDDGSSWLTLRGGTFVEATLDPLQAVSTIVAYDVANESAEAEMSLVWKWNGSESRFPLSSSGHSHG